MKRINKYLLTAFASVAMLSTTSCRDDTFESFNEQSEYVKVSFNIAPEAASVSTRGGYEDGKPSDQYNTGKLSDGGQVDMIVYGVYDKDGNLLSEYSEGVDPALVNIVGEDGHGPGQTIKKVDKFPCTFTITLKRGEEYNIAFWAQSSKAFKYYDTSDLRKVEVMYSEIEENNKPEEIDVEDGQNPAEPEEKPNTPNNDEFRDAFCRSINLVAGEGDIDRNVYLYRPLAQLNIGTAGYDYEIVTRNANVKYTHSKIRINRVARYLDVVADKTIVNNKIQGNDDSKYDYENSDAESFAVVDFGYAPIPAYATMNLFNEEGSEPVIPPFPSFTIYDWRYNDYNEYEPHPKHPQGDPEGTLWFFDYKYEQFLQVHLNGGDKGNRPGVPVSSSRGLGLEKWVTDEPAEDGFYPYANLDNYNGYDSETFKWLSMCYVLTSSTKEEARVINNVKVWVASDEKGTNEKEIININHVPLQRNWRTNIVGELLTTENEFTVVLDRNFAGDYNMWKNDDKWELSGPLANGVYYDAEHDVIEISSKEGLLWFQQMVNGKITIREVAPSSKKKVGDYYDYYVVEKDIHGKVSSITDATLVYDGVPSQKYDDALKERILYATHQKWNSNSGGEWPKNNNFHFTASQDMKSKMPEGMELQATIRLMADLDLSGEEWISIGFDGRIGEQLGWTVLDDSNNVTYSVSDKNASNRIFYGIFDGNNHTISNLSTKRFSASVHETAQQVSGFRKVYTTDTRHPSDNPQWFGRGLFGQIGGNAKVTNIRLNNVDIYGCNGVAGIVAIAYGESIEISNNIVDGGSIIATPMYRGDSYSRTDIYKDRRTFARGVYMGGIVGYFNTDKGKVDNNIVRNVYLQAVRRGGGIIGSINQKYLDVAKNVPDEGLGLVDGSWKKQRESNPASISNNRLENVIMVISSFAPYGERADYYANTKYVRSGFGWNNGNLEMYSQKFVGGHELEADKRSDISGIFRENTETGVTFAHMPIQSDEVVRRGSIEGLPLNYMPMLSSWFCDYIDLNENFYGEPSANINVGLSKFKILSNRPTNDGFASGNSFNSTGKLTNSTPGTTFQYPIILPYLVDISYDKTSPNAGVFVESVVLDGKGGIGGRSVITPLHVTEENACVMYVTARDRNQFGSKNYGESSVYIPDFMDGYDVNGTVAAYKVPTIIRNMVLRGEPYAHTGILMAPNKNLHRVELENVIIYDVYKTLALRDWKDQKDFNVWPHTHPNYDTFTRNDQFATPAKVLPFLVVKKSNLRGYTIPGSMWDYVDYKETTFEQGSDTGHGSEEYTIKVETTTNFKDCFFKAPYIIDLTALIDKNLVTFTNSQATAANQTNLMINLTKDLINKGCNWIYIGSNAQGEPYIEYIKKTGDKEEVLFKAIL